MSKASKGPKSSYTGKSELVKEQKSKALKAYERKMNKKGLEIKELER